MLDIQFDLKNQKKVLIKNMEQERFSNKQREKVILKKPKNQQNF